MINQSTTHLSKISKRKFYLIDQENCLDIIDLNQVGALWLNRSVFPEACQVFYLHVKMCKAVPNLFKSCSISSHNTTAINYGAIVSAGPIANCVGKVQNNFKPYSKKFPITYWMV